jgi:hypothetical protein
MQISFSLINDSYGLNSQGVTTRVLYVCMVLSPRFLEWNPFYQNQGNRVKGIRSCWQRMYSRFRYMQKGSVSHSRQPRPVATEYWAQVTTDCYSDQPATDCRAGASRAAPVLQRTDSFAVEIYGLGAGVCRGLGVGLVLGVAVGVGLGAAPSTAAKISTRPQP